MRGILSFVIVLCATVVLAKEPDPFSLGVRNTDPLTPQDEQKKLHPPPGFEIQLVATEPEINKPMNMAFDEKGRLWVTSTVEYPYPAKEGEGRDSIKILEDFDENGRARKVTTFAEKLNIPIGIYPWRGGAIAFDIPKISHYFDDNGDGKADRMVPLYASFGQNDTHGITNAFRRGFDGWLYACHGFNNKSVVKASDGSSIDIFSGNTYRMKIAGSHIEQFTWGQTNPFGMSVDPLGNLYDADSHSKPIYQLLRGGWYEGIFKKDDGLGLAPAMMSHFHGSSAIAGSCFYASDEFPAEFRGNVFVGNVITSRVNRDSLTYRGSTPVANEMADFIVSEDPWFRPNDIQLGPDGALYISDFYNRIIGHYEVPLDHPQRDRERGRIWRVVYVGDGAKKPAPPFDFSDASLVDLIARLSYENLKVRMLATDQIVDRFGSSAVEPVKNVVANGNAWQRIHGMWILHRLGALDEALLTAAAKDGDAPVRVHAMRVLAEIEKWNDAQRKLALAGLSDADALAQRCAADALGRHPNVENIPSLLAALHRTPAEDTHLRHVVRMSLRDQLRPAGNLAGLPANLSDEDFHAVADVTISIESADAGAFFAKNIERLSEDKSNLTRYLRHAARFAGAELEPLAGLVQKRFADDVDMQLELFKAMLDGTAQRGATLGESAKAWGAQLVDRVFQEAANTDWISQPLPASPANPWNIEKRASSDASNDAMFFTTLPGEQLTGTLRSRAFVLPAKLSFFLAGHNASEPRDAQKQNLIRLRLSGTDEVIAQTPPPRTDVAQPFSWDIKNHAGQQGYIEIVDGDDAGSYAWIAAGRFEPDAVKMPARSPASVENCEQSAAEIAAALKLASAKDPLKQMVSQTRLFPAARGAAAAALVIVGPDDAAAALAPILINPAEPVPLREKVAAALGSADTAVARAALIEGFKVAPGRVQMAIALALTENPAGAETLLSAMSAGNAPARLVLEPKIKDRLVAANVKDLDARITALTKGLPSRNDELEKLIEARRSAFAGADGKIPNGQKIFTTNCAACHTIAGVGGNVGPQLDGIGSRGVDRIIEDTLDPNRNVDPAFRYSIITRNDGELVTGLQRRQDGDKIIFADSLGKEFSIASADIKKRTESKSSLMPGNFGDIISAGDFNDLMTFLMSQKAKAPVK